MAACSGGRLSTGILSCRQYRLVFLRNRSDFSSSISYLSSSSKKWTTLARSSSITNSWSFRDEYSRRSSLCTCSLFLHNVPRRSFADARGSSTEPPGSSSPPSDRTPSSSPSSASSSAGQSPPSSSDPSPSPSTTPPSQSPPKSKKPIDRVVRVTPAPKQPQQPPPVSSPTSSSASPISAKPTQSPIDSQQLAADPQSPAIFVRPKLIGAAKAKSEYCLSDEHLKGLRTIPRRSPFHGEPPIEMYNRADVLARALTIHGSRESLDAARTRARAFDLISEENGGSVSSADAPFFSLSPPRFLKEDEEARKAKVKGIASAAWKSAGTERVVLAAVAVNLGSLCVKLGAWWWTGSHSLMAESLHSLADTINQLLVAYGVHKSLRKPDKMHPYGYSNVRYVTSLISGIGIFYLGSAMSIYHGVHGLWNLAPLESLPIGLSVLAVAFCGDGVTFLMAKQEIRKKAAAAGMTPSNYVRSGEDPSLSVVYLEDRAALVGVGIAIVSISAAFYLSNPIPDSIGSICIGLVLFQVAYKIISMNVDQLLGKSIPSKEIDQITKTLEDDPVVRSIQDIKATELGAGEIRFKAEIDFDGRHITRSYLKTIDLQKTLEEAKALKTQKDLEQFLMKHGEGITDCQGAEIDRIEQVLKKKFPDIRHVDLEAL